MDQKKYIKSIIKKLKCSHKKRKEIQRELESDINIAKENGETLAMIYQRMGTPIEVAEDFNQNFSQQEQRTRKWEIGIIIAAGILVFLLLTAAAVYCYIPRTTDINISKTFDRAVLEEQTKQVIGLLEKEDYETLKKQSIEEMKPYLNDTFMNELRESISSDWGSFVSYGNWYMMELQQKGKKMAVVQVNAAYENVSVSYRITFDVNMNLAGYYLW